MLLFLVEWRQNTFADAMQRPEVNPEMCTANLHSFVFVTEDGSSLPTHDLKGQRKR